MLKTIYLTLIRRIEARLNSTSYVYQIRKQLLARVKEQA